MLHNVRQNSFHKMGAIYVFLAEKMTMKLMHVFSATHTVVIKIGSQSISATKINHHNHPFPISLTLFFQKTAFYFVLPSEEYPTTFKLSQLAYYGRPLSVSGRPCYILPMFFYLFFYGRLILRPWLTEVRENFTRGRP